MKTAEFLEEFVDILQTDDEVNADTVLETLEDWDSMSVMACMTWFEVKLGIKVTFNSFINLKTVQEIIALSEGKISD